MPASLGADGNCNTLKYVHISDHINMHAHVQALLKLDLPHLISIREVIAHGAIVKLADTA